MPSGIHFVLQGTPNGFKQRRLLRSWLADVSNSEGFAIEELNFVLLTDEGLLEYNQKYLGHDNYTDVITFDNGPGGIIHGDVLMSYDRIKENARLQQVRLEEELRRVMVHGLLHLCGYSDKSAQKKATMTKAENKYLGRYGR